MNELLLCVCVYVTCINQMSDSGSADGGGGDGGGSGWVVIWQKHTIHFTSTQCV